MRKSRNNLSLHTLLSDWPPVDVPDGDGSYGDVDYAHSTDENETLDPLLDQAAFPLEVQLDEGTPTATDTNDLVPHSTNGSLISLDIDSDDDGGIACELCGRRFPNIVGLRTHKRSHKGNSITPGQALYKRTFFHEKHSNVVTTEGNDFEEEDVETGFSCSACKRSFPNIYGLRTHERFHGHASAPAPETQNFVGHGRVHGKSRAASKRRITSNAEAHEENYDYNGYGHVPSNASPFNNVSADAHFLTPESTPSPAKIERSETYGPTSSPSLSTLTQQSGLTNNRMSDASINNPAELNHNQKQTSTKTSLSFLRHGMFYVCKICGHRNLHINGFRSHWIRHVREGDYLKVA